MENLPDLEPVRNFIPTAYAMLEEIERQLLAQLEREQHRFVKPHLRDLDVDREGYEEWERIRKEREGKDILPEAPTGKVFLPHPHELKWLNEHDRARIRAGEEGIGW